MYDEMKKKKLKQRKIETMKTISYRCKTMEKLPKKPFWPCFSRILAFGLNVYADRNEPATTEKELHSQEKSISNSNLNSNSGRMQCNEHDHDLAYSRKLERKVLHTSMICSYVPHHNNVPVVDENLNEILNKKKGNEYSAILPIIQDSLGSLLWEDTDKCKRPIY
ncbi:hypothetical protein X798_04564 [Onchocerca flexuosa]|uniref:Uncharacterized protein n=1 Tax=Onchocerca flexuosa TaxID=387005 RepID=A0A238BTQ5_9BILA|nr:hypothetical protein X798_04564 [Onchocerca flexuosa]